MSGTAMSVEAADASLKHARLLREAVQGMLGLQPIMRLAVQRLRSEQAQATGSPPGGDFASRQGRGAAVGEAQHYVLHVLSTAGPLTVGEIADRCHVADPTISKILNHLETSGLIERRIEPTNRRTVRVSLTDAGRAAEAWMAERFQLALAGVLDPMADDELHDLVIAFGHLSRLANETDEAAGGRDTFERSTSEVG